MAPTVYVLTYYSRYVLRVEVHTTGTVQSGPTRGFKRLSRQSLSKCLLLATCCSLLTTYMLLAFPTGCCYISIPIPIRARSPYDFLGIHTISPTASIRCVAFAHVAFKSVR
ncbi:hypothetical protein BZA77DRAFT_321329 [Pyronema omphalodes]|nr:hypothetical protein BZA77DRAFT_321329 [Pyronema omphalodes]